jgi:Fe2+ or Zn2+ uptake regulation protein
MEGTITSPFINIFRRYLREQGLPITQQRETVAALVFNSSDHLSVEDIEAALNLVRQAKPGLSCELKGAHHVKCL